MMSAQYVLLDEKSNEITKQSLYDIHQHQLSRNQTNQHKTRDIVFALGGIDEILSHYLSLHNNLSQQQLHEIDDILTTNSNSVSDSQAFSYYKFEKSNNIIHKLFNAATATRITQFFTSIYVY